MKLLKSILILSLIMCVCVTASYADQLVEIDGDYQPYNIGVEKKIEVPFAFVIKYVTTATDGKEATLKGTIEVNAQYKIIQLDLDYYIMNGQKKSVRATSLNLVKNKEVPTPAIFDFEYSYKLDLQQYEYEIFSLIFIVEEIDTKHI